MAESAQHKMSDEPGEAVQPAPYTTKVVQAGNVRLSYLDYGTAGRPTMLCVHGGAAHAHWYDFIAPGFTSDYHVISIDLRGHGDSDWADPPSYSYHDYAADLNIAIEKLDLRDFVLIGHSMGGAVSLLYAAIYPGRVKSLIVIDSSINLSPDRIAKMRDVGARPGNSFATKEELVSRYKLRPGDALATPAIVRYIASHSVRESEDGTWKHKFDRNVYATREISDGRPSWNKIRIPTLLVKGDRSERLSPEVVADIRARCPQAELAVVADSYHHVTLDNPTMFIDVVKPFLAKHP